MAEAQCNAVSAALAGTGSARWADGLPDWHELVAAICGHAGDGPDAHPVTRCARALAELRTKSPSAAGFADMRAGLVERIDLWGMQFAPFIARCSESLGEAVDALARTHLEAEAALAAGRDAETWHAAWLAASERAVAWTDLCAEAMWGQRRVP
ncbi:hypothetical protein [Nocardia yamanashiensis]|uniref:hypothetical protein n=1 Tax=Nocardia yamanashiensis TaxID=209247 RepID=UPI000A4A4D13|nr:hypothetical protein [Nocardia yamanashiensis]